jgi:hypothetical protein
MELVDLVDQWRAQEMLGVTMTGDEGNQFMIRAKVGVGSKTTELCWEMEANDNGIVMRPCDPEKPKQWFTVGPCIDTNNLTIPDGQCPLHRAGIFLIVL